MKHKYSRKDKKVAKKSKTPANKKKLVSKKKAARRAPVAAPYEPPVTLGFESSAAVPIEPEALADSAQEAQEPTPEIETVP